MKRGEFEKFVVESLKELRERVEKIEVKLETSRENATKTIAKTNSISVNLSRMNVTLRQAKKGVALIIRFAKYIKPNKNNQVYVVLTKEDVEHLRRIFNAIRVDNDDDDYGNGNVEVTTPDNAL